MAHVHIFFWQGMRVEFCIVFEKSPGKRLFWKCGFSLFCESVVENARFGRLRSQFLGKSRGKRSILEGLNLSICESLVENARFARLHSQASWKTLESARFGSLPSQLPRGKRSFWKYEKKGRARERKGNGKSKRSD